MGGSTGPPAGTGMIRFRPGLVVAVTARRPGATELVVEVEGERAPALAYDGLTGPVSPGDRVLLNTSAVSLGLGTGGVHLVMANPARTVQDLHGPGHIMKLRYTPLQVRVLAVEEPAHPGSAALAAFEGLAGMPVVLCGVHSQVAPAAAGVQAGAGRPVRVAYVMTDSAALPLAFSRLVPALLAAGLVATTITAGQAFGGDFEAVNLYSALGCARAVAGAEVAVVGPGPGGVGTGTRLGFSGIEVAGGVDAVSRLDGIPVVAPRVSLADLRPRHRGISHHTLTCLRLAYAPAVLALPVLDGAGTDELLAQVRAAGLEGRHGVEVHDGRPALERLAAAGIPLESMGRGPGEDPAYFLAAGAAGVAAAGRLRRAGQTPGG